MLSLNKQASGFTLIELMVSVALISIIAAVATSSYQQYIERAEIDRAFKDITIIQLQIDAYAFSNDGSFPSSLAGVGLDGYEDPWGNTYKYLNISETKGNGKKRKDRNLVPINSDYDLYSMGPDGQSVSPLTAKSSKDDIIRASNGAFLGVAEDY